MVKTTTMTTQPTTTQLEGGTYDILRNRLQKHGADLRTRLELLNQERKSVFGAIETALLATERVTTEHNCVPMDMVPVGYRLLFGYNVHLGLKAEVELADVFSVFTYEGHAFHHQPLELIQDQAFREDFQKLYKYYKHTQFVKFAVLGAHLQPRGGDREPHRAVLVGAPDGDPGVAQRGEGARRRMAVVVLSDRDPGDLGAQAVEQLGQTGVGAAVMGDLHSLDIGQRERLERVAFGVAG